MLDTTGKVRTDELVTFYKGFLHMDTLVLADKEKIIFMCWHLLLINGLEWWTMGTVCERERERERERENNPCC